MNLAGFRALVRKDLVLYFSNRRALVMSIAAPIVIAAFFGAIFGSGSDKPSRIPIALADRDASVLSQAVAASVAADPAFELSNVDAAAAVALVRQGKVRAAVVIPAGFGAQTRGNAGLVDLLDRVLDKGLVVAGDIKVSLAEVELLTIRIRLMICSIDKAEAIGLDWWKYDRHLSPGRERVMKENVELREQVRALERRVDTLTRATTRRGRALPRGR